MLTLVWPLAQLSLCSGFDEAYSLFYFTLIAIFQQVEILASWKVNSSNSGHGIYTYWYIHDVGWYMVSLGSLFNP